MEKKNIIIIVLSVLVIGLFGYIVYDKIYDEKNDIGKTKEEKEEIVDNDKTNDNNVNDKNDNVKDDNDNVSDENIGENNQPIIEKNKNIFTNYIGPLGWIAYISSFDNNSEIKKNIDFFSDDYNKTLFAMEYIYENDGDVNFVKIVPENGPCCQYYYSYEKFEDIYINIFDEKFDNNIVNIEGNKYVYYDFYRKFGSNGVYAENINIIDIITEGELYIATVEIEYSDATKMYSNIEKINATIKYKKNEGKIIFKSFIVN